MSKVVDITGKLQRNKEKEREKEQSQWLLDIAHYIQEGLITEIIGIVGDCDGNYYISLPRGMNEPIKAKDFKDIMANYIDQAERYK